MFNLSVTTAAGADLLSGTRAGCLLFLLSFRLMMQLTSKGRESSTSLSFLPKTRVGCAFSHTRRGSVRSTTELFFFTNTIEAGVPTAARQEQRAYPTGETDLFDWTVL